MICFQVSFLENMILQEMHVIRDNDHASFHTSSSTGFAILTHVFLESNGN